MACRRVVKKDGTVAKLVGSGKKEPCAFCGHEADDEILYGKLYAIGNIQCHYFCVLLSCCLVQRGKYGDGLLGFLYPDILAEVERSKKHKCSYCSRGGATLGCSVGACRKQFHLPCGRERQAVSLFYDNYRSYCKDHAPKQKVADNVMAKAQVRMREHNKMKKSIGALRAAAKKNIGPVSVDSEGAGGPVCVICYEPVLGFPTPSTFWPPCCARDAWFHRACLQRMALSAGMHYLKCPLCNDKEVFYEAVVTNGYYVPDRDASWEMEQDAFADMYERAAQCGAPACRCPAGRRHDADGGPWDIKMCLLCGSCGVHAQCMLPSPPASPPASPLGVPPPCVVPLDVPPPARYVCPTCSPAAPADLDQLESSIAAVILTERSVGGGAAARRGPVMPSRMSLRRTKMRPHATAPASSSNSSTERAVVAAPKASSNTSLSRQELNLKSPRKPHPEPPGEVLQAIDNRLASPMKLLERGVRDKLAGRGAPIDDRVLDKIRRKFNRPRPLSVKRRIVNGILEELLSNKKESPKSKGPLRIWISPKKSPYSESTAEAQLNGSTKENNSETPKKQQTPTRVNLERTPVKIVKDEATAECIQTSIDSGNKEVFVEDCPATDVVESLPELVDSSLETFVKDEDITECIQGSIDSGNKEVFVEDCPATDVVELLPEHVDSSLETFVKDEDRTECIQGSTDGGNKEVFVEDCPATDVVESLPELVDSSLETFVKDEDRTECIQGSTDGGNKEVFVEEIVVESLPELVAGSNCSLETLETPKKLTTVDIRKDSSMEISKRDEVIDIVLIEIEDVSGGGGLKIKDMLLKSPPRTEKCALKFNPVDKERLETCNVGIDVESFKHRYLNEVDREFRCTFSHNHGRSDNCDNSTLKTAIDFAYEAASKLEEKGNVGKRKLDEAASKLEEKVNVGKRKLDEAASKLEEKGSVGKRKLDEAASKLEEKGNVGKRKIDEAASKLEEKGSVGKRKLDDENGSKKKMKTENIEDDVLDREEPENTAVCDEKSEISKNSVENRVRRMAQRRQQKTASKKGRRKKADASATGDAFVDSSKDRVSKRKPMKKVKKSRNKDSKTLSIKNKNINVKIRFRRNEFNVNIKSNKRDGKTRQKNRAMAKPKKLKQYVLKYSPEVTSPRKSIAKPDKDFTPKKRKYVRHEKSSDNLVQTSIDNFFKLKFSTTV